MPEALAGPGRDEGGDVEPFEAAVSDGQGTGPPRRPDAAEDRLQPDAALVGGEGLDRRAGMALRLLGDRRSKASLSSACASGRAARACRGRGAWIVQPIARSASQPRCSATEASPSSVASTAATFLEVQTPPSSGGLVSRSRSIAGTEGVRIVAFAPFPRRRSPREVGPKRLQRPSSSSTQRGTKPVSRAVSVTGRPGANSQITR